MPKKPQSTAREAPRALLVSIKTPEITADDAADSLRELERLVTTLGFDVAGTDSQKMPKTTGPTAVGAGKLQDLVARVKDLPATVVVFDCDLRPSQLRHLENALGVEVLDRTGVIIEIFSRHAKTRTAKLQVEIARLNYLSPRLRETGSSGERQSGRGAGESALALERHAIRDRLAELRGELGRIQKDATDHRGERATQYSVALVGYTNAGKSSTMRALTGSEVLVENKLFATLDTTVRALKPETNPRILVSDTVGFIKKLPHDLVASFRSTLDEAKHAFLLLYLVDASDPGFRAQLTVVEEVLGEVGAGETPHLLVLNKIDLVAPEVQKRLAREFPGAVFLSNLDAASVKALRAQIIEFFEKEMIDETLFVPYSAKGVIGEIRERARVLNERHDDQGTHFTVRGVKSEVAKLKRKLK